VKEHNAPMSFSDFKNSLVSEFRNIDPVAWAQNNLVLDGKKFDISAGTGWEFLHEIYRYIGIDATSRYGRPVIILKGRQVGATLLAQIMSLFFSASGHFKNLTGLHAFPIVTQAQRFSNQKFDPLVNDSRPVFKKRFTPGSMDTGDLKPAGVWNASTKQFRDNNSLLIEGISADGGRVRGMSANYILFDEVQDILAPARQNVRQSLKMASTKEKVFGPIGQGVEVNFGTPHEAGSPFDKLWQMSDQRFFNLRCQNKRCKELFPLYVYGSSSWKDVWIKEFTVQCVHCGFLQDKRKCTGDGEWIPTNVNLDCNCGGTLSEKKSVYTCGSCGATDDTTHYRGYHWNQLFIPFFSKEFILKQEKELDPLVFSTEVLGEFYSGMSSPLSYEQLYAACAKDHADIKMPDFLLPSTGREISLGVDWGGKVDDSTPGGSWTVATVMSRDLTGTEKIPYRVEHCELIPEQKQSLQIEIIEEIMKNYGIGSVVADIGFGHQQLIELQMRYGDRVKACYSSGNIKKPLDYNSKNFMITINKDIIIEEMVELFRNGRVLFPFGEPDKIDWLMRHCTSMQIEHFDIHGAKRKRYKKTTRPNDGLMALMYAYLAIKFKVTSGFTNLTARDYGDGQAMPSPHMAYAPTGNNRLGSKGFGSGNFYRG